MELAIICALGFLLVVAWVTARRRRRYIQRLEYICQVNSKRLRFYYSPGEERMMIEVAPRDGAAKWHGDVDKVYTAFASPTGWGARDSIHGRAAKLKLETDDDYQPGAWKESEQ